MAHIYDPNSSDTPILPGFYVGFGSDRVKTAAKTVDEIYVPVVKTKYKGYTLALGFPVLIK
jgi:hypothetical protein